MTSSNPILVLGTIFLFMFICPAISGLTIGDLEFHSDFQSLMESSQESRKPALIKFYTDWCVWCKVLEDSTLPDPYVQKFLKNFELGSINAEVDTLVAEKYGVRSYPTVLLLQPDGIEIDRLIGYSPPEEFVSSVVKSLVGIGTLEDLLSRLEQTPDDLELRYEVGEKYMYKGEYGKAMEYFQDIIRRDTENALGLASLSAYRLAYMAYKEKDYLAAAEQYSAVSERFPDSDQALDAELMTAYSLQKAEEYARAEQQYRLFLKSHPETEEREWIEEQLEKMK